MAQNKVCVASNNPTVLSRYGCAKDLLKLSDLNQKSVKMKHMGDISPAEAIRGRIGLFEGNDSDLYICKSHLTSLIKNFKIGETCSMPAEFSSHPNERRKVYRSIAFSESEAVLHVKDKLIPVGKGRLYKAFIEIFCAVKEISLTGLCCACSDEVERIKAKYDDDNVLREREARILAVAKRQVCMYE